LNKYKKFKQEIDREKYYLDQAQKIGNFGIWKYDVINESIRFFLNEGIIHNHLAHPYKKPYHLIPNAKKTCIKI
jgi:hypothetical protein